MTNTKLNLLVLFALLLTSTISNAYNVPKIQDTTKTKHILDELATRPPLESEYRINKNSFHIKYGFDFTAKRIIDLHFAKKTRYILYILSPIIVYVFLIFVLILISFFIGITGNLFLLFSFLLYIGSWVLRIVGIVKYIQHKSIDLLYQLIEYRKTGASPFGQKPIPSKNDEKDYYEKK